MEEDDGGYHSKDIAERYERICLAEWEVPYYICPQYAGSGE